MKPVFAHIKGDASYWNLGDEASMPAQYFPEYADCQVVALNDVAALPAGQPVILGGGGILAFPKFIKATALRRPTIIFGAGLNNAPDFDRAEVVDALNECALVGIRDRRFAERHGFTYVPCASCMHPAFRAGLDPMRNTLSFHHAWHAAPPGGEIVVSNMDRSLSVDNIIRIVCASRTVISNSYHGAYWSIIAGRRTILWRVWDLRFFSGLPYMPPIVYSNRELKMALDFSPTTAKLSSIDCQARNEEFRNQVNSFLATI